MLSFPACDLAQTQVSELRLLLRPLADFFSSCRHQVFRSLDYTLEVWDLLESDGLRPEPVGGLSGD
jgi:hypothetical protein